MGREICASREGEQGRESFLPSRRHRRLCFLPRGSIPSSPSCQQALVPVPPAPGISNPDANQGLGLLYSQKRFLQALIQVQREPCLFLCHEMLTPTPGAGEGDPPLEGLPKSGAWEKAAGEGDGGGCSSCGTSCPFFCILWL